MGSTAKSFNIRQMSSFVADHETAAQMSYETVFKKLGKPNNEQMFNLTAKNVAQQQQVDWKMKQFEDENPEYKYNPKVLGILQSRSNAPSYLRKASPISGRGGGSIGMATPKLKSVIPKGRIHGNNQDLGIFDTFRTKRNQSLQHNTYALKSANSPKMNSQNQQIQRMFNTMVNQHLEKQQQEKTQNMFIEQVDNHYEWLNSQVTGGSVENQRLKQKILEFSHQKCLQTIMSKIWFIILQLNYGGEDLKSNIELLQQIPLNRGIYQMTFQLIIKSLSIFLRDQKNQVDRFCAYNENNYQKKYVFFDRFKFDVCSLISEKIENNLLLDESFEVILRNVYKQITFQKIDQVHLRQFKDVQQISAFRNLFGMEQSEMQLPTQHSLTKRWGDNEQKHVETQPSFNGSIDMPTDEQATQEKIMAEAANHFHESIENQINQSYHPDQQLSSWSQFNQGNSHYLQQTSNQGLPADPNRSTANTQGGTAAHSPNATVSPKIVSHAASQNTQVFKQSQQIMTQRSASIDFNQFTNRSSLNQSPPGDLRPLTLPGFKHESIQEVLSLKDNQKYLQKLQRNPFNGSYNPNDHICVPKGDPRLLQLKAGCNRGIHQKEMNYHVTEQMTRGQKEMIHISNQINDNKRYQDMMKKQQRLQMKIQKSKKEKGGNPMSEFGGDNRTEQFTMTPKSPKKAENGISKLQISNNIAELKGFQQIQHRRVYQQDIMMGGFVPGAMASYDSRRVATKSPRGGQFGIKLSKGNRQAKNIYDKFMYGTYKGQKADSNAHKYESEQNGFSEINDIHDFIDQNGIHPMTHQGQEAHDTFEREGTPQIRAPSPKKSKYLAQDHNKIGKEQKDKTEAAEVNKQKDQLKDKVNYDFLEKLINNEDALEIIVTDQEQNQLIEERLKLNDTLRADPDAENAMKTSQETKQGNSQSNSPSQHSFKDLPIDGPVPYSPGIAGVERKDTEESAFSPTNLDTDPNQTAKRPVVADAMGIQENLTTDGSKRVGRKQVYNKTPDGSQYSRLRKNERLEVDHVRDESPYFTHRHNTGENDRNSVFAKRQNPISFPNVDFEFRKNEHSDNSQTDYSRSKRSDHQHISALKQKKLQAEIEKYKKFEKLNTKSKMITQQIPGIDGYKPVIKFETIMQKDRGKQDSPGHGGLKRGTSQDIHHTMLTKNSSHELHQPQPRYDEKKNAKKKKTLNAFAKKRMTLDPKKAVVTESQESRFRRLNVQPGTSGSRRPTIYGGASTLAGQSPFPREADLESVQRNNINPMNTPFTPKTNNSAIKVYENQQLQFTGGKGHTQYAIEEDSPPPGIAAGISSRSPAGKNTIMNKTMQNFSDKSKRLGTQGTYRTEYLVDGDQKQGQPKLLVDIKKKSSIEVDESEKFTDGNTSFGGKTPQKLPQITRFNVFQQDTNSRNQNTPTLSQSRNEIIPQRMGDTLRMNMGETLKLRGVHDPLDQILHQDAKSPEEQLETLQTFKKLLQRPRNNGDQEEDREDYAPLLSPHIAHIQKGPKHQTVFHGARMGGEKTKEQYPKELPQKQVQIEDYYADKSEVRKQMNATVQPIMDTSLKFQRRNIHAMQKQNRDTVTRQRKEQKELKIISQYKMVQKQYQIPPQSNTARNTPVATRQQRKENYRNVRKHLRESLPAIRDRIVQIQNIHNILPQEIHRPNIDIPIAPIENNSVSYSEGEGDIQTDLNNFQSSPRGSPGSGILTNNKSLRCSTTTIDGQNQKMRHTPSPPWLLKELNVTKGSSKQYEIDHKNSNETVRLREVGLPIINQRKLQPNPGATKFQISQDQLAPRTSSGEVATLESDLITEFLDFNKQFLSQAVETGNLSPAIINIVKGLNDFNQMPSLPVVIPQPLTAKRQQSPQTPNTSNQQSDHHQSSQFFDFDQSTNDLYNQYQQLQQLFNNQKSILIQYRNSRLKSRSSTSVKRSSPSNSILESKRQGNRPIQIAKVESTQKQVEDEKSSDLDSPIRKSLMHTPINKQNISNSPSVESKKDGMPLKDYQTATERNPKLALNNIQAKSMARKTSNGSAVPSSHIRSKKTSEQRLNTDLSMVSHQHNPKYDQKVIEDISSKVKNLNNNQDLLEEDEEVRESFNKLQLEQVKNHREKEKKNIFKANSPQSQQDHIFNYAQNLHLNKESKMSSRDEITKGEIDQAVNSAAEFVCSPSPSSGSKHVRIDAAAFPEKTRSYPQNLMGLDQEMLSPHFNQEQSDAKRQVVNSQRGLDNKLDGQVPFQPQRSRCSVRVPKKQDGKNITSMIMTSANQSSTQNFQIESMMQPNYNHQNFSILNPKPDHELTSDSELKHHYRGATQVNLDQLDKISDADEGVSHRVTPAESTRRTSALVKNRTGMTPTKQDTATQIRNPSYSSMSKNDNQSVINARPAQITPDGNRTIVDTKKKQTMDYRSTFPHGVDERNLSPLDMINDQSRKPYAVGQPIGYNVMINAQAQIPLYQHTATLPDQESQGGDLAQQYTNRKLSAEHTVEDNVLAGFGTDKGKELYEQYRRKDDGRELLSKRKTSGFSNELIKFAEKIAEQAQQVENNHHLPTKASPTTSNHIVTQTQTDNYTSMNKIQMLIQDQAAKKVVIPNTKLPQGTIKQRYWQYNKQMSPRVLPTQAKINVMEFGTPDKQSFIPSGTFGKRSKSIVPSANKQVTEQQAKFKRRNINETSGPLQSYAQIKAVNPSKRNQANFGFSGQQSQSFQL